MNVDRHIAKRNQIHQIAEETTTKTTTTSDEESTRTNSGKYKIIFFSSPNPSYAYNSVNWISIKLDF